MSSFLLFRLVKENSYCPDVCVKCHRYFERLDIHLVTSHSLNRNEEEFKELLKNGRQQRSKSSTVVTEKSTTVTRTLTKGSRTLSKKFFLTADKKKELNIRRDDRFRWFYKSSSDLLNDFRNYLMRICNKSLKTTKNIINLN